MKESTLTWMFHSPCHFVKFFLILQRKDGRLKFEKVYQGFFMNLWWSTFKFDKVLRKFKALKNFQYKLVNLREWTYLKEGKKNKKTNKQEKIDK